MPASPGFATKTTGKMGRAGDKADQTDGCRFCGGALVEFLDLGMSPLCESYRSREQLHTAESFYPLDLKICPGCLLVQLSAYVSREDDPRT